METTNKIGEFIRKNQERKQAHWRLKDGEWYFNHDGFWMEQKYFDKYYPKYDYQPFNEKGESPGKTYPK